MATQVTVVEGPAVQSVVEDNDEAITTVNVPQDVVTVAVPEDPGVVFLEVAVAGPQGPAGPATIPFSRSGEAAVMVGQQPFYLDYSGRIAFARASVGTAPTGSSLIVDINKNGSTIYATQANRPSIPAGDVTGLGGVPDSATFEQNDYLTIDIDQVGSTFPGADLVVTLTLERE